MATGAHTALTALDRAAQKHLDMLLGTHQLDGDGAIERGTGNDDPGLLVQVLNGILAGLQTMQPTLYHQTVDACKWTASGSSCATTQCHRATT